MTDLRLQHALGLQHGKVLHNGKEELHLIRVLRDGKSGILLGSIYITTRSGWAVKVYVTRVPDRDYWTRDTHFTELG
jgi:hypothetical protein